MMKAHMASVAVLSTLIVVLAVFMWFRPDKTTRMVLASSLADTGTVVVKVDRFEWTRQLPGRLTRIPPTWMVRYPWMIKVWSMVFRDTQYVGDGLVWCLVEATVIVSPPLQSDEFDFRLDYGAYTIGTSRRAFLPETGQPGKISTQFRVTDGPLPEALEIGVRGEWIRFPIEMR